MNFLIQRYANFTSSDFEIVALKQAIEAQSYEYSYKEITIDEITSDTDKQAIPVGSIQFVQRYLEVVHGRTENMNPIEVPKELRFEKFLKRQYSIVDYEHLPKSGYWFIKDVSQLKNGTYLGRVPALQIEGFDSDHLFVVSEVKNILSEYRVIVYQDKIEAIQFYDGDPTIMPTPDEIKKIKEMVLRYSQNRNRPGAYTLDVAIVKEGDGRDLMLLEVHSFVSVGVYSDVGYKLPKMYIEGFKWQLEQNLPLEL